VEAGGYIVSTWKLLTMVTHDRIFSRAALAWVDAIVWAIAAAWVQLLGLFLYLAINSGDPGLPHLLLLIQHPGGHVPGTRLPARRPARVGRGMNGGFSRAVQIRNHEPGGLPAALKRASAVLLALLAMSGCSPDPLPPDTSARESFARPELFEAGGFRQAQPAAGPSSAA